MSARYICFFVPEKKNKDMHGGIRSIFPQHRQIRNPGPRVCRDGALYFTGMFSPCKQWFFFKTHEQLWVEAQRQWQIPCCIKLNKKATQRNEDGVTAWNIDFWSPVCQENFVNTASNDNGESYSGNERKIFSMLRTILAGVVWWFPQVQQDARKLLRVTCGLCAEKASAKIDSLMRTYLYLSCFVQIKGLNLISLSCTSFLRHLIQASHSVTQLQQR